MPFERKYRWEDWFTEGTTTTLVRGVDYKCSTTMFWQQARNWAYKLGVRAKIVADGDSVTISEVWRKGNEVERVGSGVPAGGN